MTQQRRGTARSSVACQYPAAANHRQHPEFNKISLPDGLGACSLDIEMETGTGKTYVYIKTMFELNKRYGSAKLRAAKLQ